MSFESREKRLIEKKVIYLETQEEAVKVIKDFWRSMPHARDLALPEDDDNESWMQELTMGDRTIVRKAVAPTEKEKGKWLVFIMGNHQPLTNEAVSWLEVKGYLK